MTSGADKGYPRTVEPFDHEAIEGRIRQAASDLSPDRLVDEIELRHLSRVVTDCAMLLTDVYSDDRLERILHPERGALTDLIDRMIEQRDRGDGEVLFRVRRLPDDVRMVGDKALFDVGLLGVRRVKGHDLEGLGTRAYRVAAEVLDLLAEDRILRDFFRRNRLLMLPIEEEATFLRQCSERFPVYASILRRLQAPEETRVAPLLEGLKTRVPLMAAAARALADAAEPLAADPPSTSRPDDPYAEAVRADAGMGDLLPKDELLSAYERMVLFASLDLGKLREALRHHVVDQEEAIETLCDEFGLFAAGTRDLRKPPAYFLVGPTGVGKNHLVETLSRALESIWKVEIPVLVVEGPNYTYPSDINELRGATRGFIRSDEEGLLAAFHERSSRAPFSVILVDEVEKAHPHLRTFFLSILDRGTTTDNRGRVLNFANSLIFFTSNLGYSDSQQRSAPIGYMEEESRQRAADTDVRRDIRRGLSPEFVNRLRVVHFRRLTAASAERILDLETERIARRYREVHGVDLVLDRSAREELIRRGFSPVHGARHLATLLESVCNVAVSKRIRCDDRKPDADRRAILSWLREIRAGGRAYDPDEVRRRVLETVRARLDYGAVRIAFRDGEFSYRPEGSRD